MLRDGHRCNAVVPRYFFAGLRALDSLLERGTDAVADFVCQTRAFTGAFVQVTLNTISGSPGKFLIVSASVVITRLTATRIKGVFSGVLGPAPGFSSPETATITNGVFDIGLR